MNLRDLDSRFGQLEGLLAPVDRYDRLKRRVEHAGHGYGRYGVLRGTAAARALSVIDEQDTLGMRYLKYKAIERSHVVNVAKLRDVRKSRGLTQKELAYRLHTDQPRIAKIENGLSVPERTAQRIADALLCSVSDLVKPEEPTVTFKVSELSPEILQLLAEK